MRVKCTEEERNSIACCTQPHSQVSIKHKRDLVRRHPDSVSSEMTLFIVVVSDVSDKHPTMFSHLETKMSFLHC